MCLSCIKADKWAIFYVPDKFRTLDFCRMAVVDYNNDIRCVPHNIRIQLIVETLDGLHGDPYQLEYAIVPKFNRFFELRGRFEQLGI
jgi:hypothetical protein